MALDPKLHELPDHVKDAMQKVRPPAAGEPDLKQRDYRFHINWKAPSGEVFEGWFVHRFPNIGQQISIAHAVDAACRARSGHFIEESAQDVLIAICNLEPTLVERPAWAKNLADLTYPDLLFTVAKEVRRHAACFRGDRDPEAKSP